MVLALGVELRCGWELRSIAETTEASPGTLGAPEPMGTAAERVGSARWVLAS